MLTYSLRPRGGVVHALEISDALARRGHEIELIALGPPGEQFFRPPAVPSRIVRYEPVDAPFDERIMAMLAAYRDGLAGPLRSGRFDLIHSQDCLSANAALELRDAGAVPHVIRTVHHIDDFTSASLVECQNRSILRPDALLCVSEPWVTRLAGEFGLSAELVSNGVDTSRHRPARDTAERSADRARFDLGEHFTVLTIGGIEPRKGSLALLVPVGDGDALGDALARLARSPETRARLRAEGLSVAATYTWDRAAIEHERVYRQVLASLGAVGIGRV